MHAYLIIAHEKFEQLNLLLKALDYVDNAIYIHIDKKCGDICKSAITKGITHAKVVFINRMSVTWGDYSQIECELRLIEAACEHDYQYIHLLSGVDFPIKPHEYIVDFFQKNNGKEFVHFQRNGYEKREDYKVKYWYIFHRFVGKEKARESIMAAILWASIAVQRRIGIDRTKSDKYPLYKGANWFSITGDFAKYVCSKKKYIRNRFKYTHCCDEFFLQTVLMNSPFSNNLFDKSFSDNYEGCLRAIDWKRGNPYIFRLGDYEQLISSKAVFGRKFDIQVDPEIISRLLKI